MAKASGFGDAPVMTRELRESFASAFETLSDWRDAIDKANERYLNKVLDQTSDVARSMGWTDHAIETTREHLTRISKAQTDKIDQVMDSWKHQLSSPASPKSMPPNFSRGMTGTTSSLAGALPLFNPLEPWEILVSSSRAVATLVVAGGTSERWAQALDSVSSGATAVAIRRLTEVRTLSSVALALTSGRWSRTSRM